MVVTAPARPRFRGSLHRWSIPISIAAAAPLVAISGALLGARAAVATAVYGVTALGLFGVSALYHRTTWSTPRHELLMRRLDHTMIFLLIAGTYTPLSLFALPSSTGRQLLIVVWAGALGGILLRLLWPATPPAVAVPVYLTIGWPVAFVIPTVTAHAGVATLVLVLTGCGLYTIGGVFFATRWPDPWPTTFGYHEFFHAATVLAATCHYVAIWMAMFR